MNIFKHYLYLIKESILSEKNILKLESTNEFRGITLESPPSEFDFDLSCNVSLILAKKNNQIPKELAKNIKKILLNKVEDFIEIEIAGPGFLNIKLSKYALKKIIENIFENKKKYGSNPKNESYNIEFVSANPTGPMHVGHCRGAIYGDVLANLLIFNGNEVTKEYYINDYGNQINNFAKSVYLRIREILFNEVFVIKKDLYPGEYIIDIAKNILKNSNNKFETYDKNKEFLINESLKYSMNMIKADLKKLGIEHNNFFSEMELVKKDLVQKTINKLKKGNYVVEGFLKPPKGEEQKNWKQTKRLIFKSTSYGDDTDRALQKNDGSWTYFANDVAYHMDKVSRNYNHLINILGADHTGYIKRITAAVSAISNNKIKLICRVCQLVKLYKDGKPFKMSKRSGDFISANDLLNEVDKDSIRFMMLNRSNDVELDFDFNKVLEKNKDNPVFYVQYCFARINSLMNLTKRDFDEQIHFNIDKVDLNVYEKKILRKIFDWPKILDTASNKFEPHRIPYYLYDLATLFHSYWSKGNENEKYKFISDNKIKNENTLLVIKLVSIVIENGMKILGVSTPKKM